MHMQSTSSPGAWKALLAVVVVDHVVIVDHVVVAEVAHEARSPAAQNTHARLSGFEAGALGGESGFEAPYHGTWFEAVLTLPGFRKLLEKVADSATNARFSTPPLARFKAGKLFLPKLVSGGEKNSFLYFIGTLSGRF